MPRSRKISLDDPNALPSVFVGDETSQRLLSEVEKRGKSGVVEVGDLAGWTDTSRANVVHFFRKLDSVGVGRFVIGRKGAESRFMWASQETQPASEPKRRGRPPGSRNKPKLSPASLDAPAPAAAPATPVAKPAAAPAVRPAIAEAPAPEVPAGMVEHVFNLRLNFQARIMLPANLTDHEARRLAGFITSLPMA
jgi:hypothetical protein